MANPHHVVIEMYVLLSIINAFLGISQGIYQDAHPTESIRSPFTGFPLGSDFPILDSEGVTLNMTIPTNSSGGVITWVSNAMANFEATIEVILYFVQFFTAGFIVDLLTSMGFPGGFLLIVTVPMALYVMYMTFVMITNRLGN